MATGESTKSMGLDLRLFVEPVADELVRPLPDVPALPPPLTLLLITRGGGAPGDLLEDVEGMYPGGGGGPRWWIGSAPGGDALATAGCCWRWGAGRGWPPLWLDDEPDWNCSPGITGVLPSWKWDKCKYNRYEEECFFLYKLVIGYVNSE